MLEKPDYLVTTTPCRRSIDSDWFVNSFIVVVYEIIILWTPNSDWIKKILKQSLQNCDLVTIGYFSVRGTIAYLVIGYKFTFWSKSEYHYLPMIATNFFTEILINTEQYTYWMVGS